MHHLIVAVYLCGDISIVFFILFDSLILSYPILCTIHKSNTTLNTTRRCVCVSVVHYIAIDVIVPTDTEVTALGQRSG